MTEWEEREKVIKGLLVQIHRMKDTQRQLVTNGTAMFPYIEIEALYDVLDLLKAQEPRVMTYAESMLNPDCDVVWLEVKGDAIIEPVIPIFAVNKYATVLCESNLDEGGQIRLTADQCGKAYRPWSSRPTDEQRKAVKWDG